MSSLSERSLCRRIAAGAVAAVVALGLTTASATADGDSGDDPITGVHDLEVDVTDHGPVGTEVSTSQAEVGTLPDGTNVQYIAGTGSPGVFTVVDAETGELIDAQEVPPKTGAGPIQALPDGSAYFNFRDGQAVIFYHWDSETHEITEVMTDPADGKLVRELQLGEDGLLYGSTYPNTRVFSYDPETEEVRDYGDVLEPGDADMYAEGFSVHEGTAYVGTGMQNGNLISVDLDSGESAEMELPPDYEGIERFYRFQQVGDLIAMAFSPSISGTTTLFWDTADEEWVCDGAIDTALSLNNPYTEPTEDGRFFYKADDEIWEFDSADCSISPTGWIDTDLEDTGTHRALNQFVSAAGEETLLGLNRDGTSWAFEPATGEQQVFENQVPGSALRAHSLHVASDDRVYMGTYNGPGTLGRFDPATQEMEQIEGPSQADSFLTLQDDDLVMGSYGNAVVHRGDPAADWDYGTNPSEQFRLIDEQQDRIVDQDTDGELVAMATVADYGVRGGGLTLTDMSERGVTHRDLVEAQSTASVAFGDDGLLYAGTSIQGGLSSENSPLDAHLLVVDPQTGDVLDSVVPVEGNPVVAGIAVLGETVWAITNSGDLVEYDTVTREVVEVHDLGTEHSSSPWGLASTIQENPVDGLLYGISGTQVFVVDPEGGEMKILLDDTEYKRLDIADDGTVYVIDETNLFSFDVDGVDEDPRAQLEALSAATAEYIESGEISGRSAHHLPNALAQAQKHLDLGRDSTAAQRVEAFVEHLDDAGVPDSVSEEARVDLIDQARGVLDVLE